MVHAGFDKCGPRMVAHRASRRARGVPQVVFNASWASSKGELVAAHRASGGGAHVMPQVNFPGSLGSFNGDSMFVPRMCGRAHAITQTDCLHSLGQPEGNAIECTQAARDGA